MNIWQQTPVHGGVLDKLFYFLSVEGRGLLFVKQNTVRPALWGHPHALTSAPLEKG